MVLTNIMITADIINVAISIYIAPDVPIKAIIVAAIAVPISSTILPNVDDKDMPYS